MSFRERLLLAINELGMNRNSFSEKLGYDKNTYIYEYTREEPKPKEPGFDFFQRFVQAKTGINLGWLLTGEGDMKEKKHTAATNIDEAAVSEERELIKTLEKAVAILDRDNEKLWALVERLTGAQAAIPNEGQ